MENIQPSKLADESNNAIKLAVTIATDTIVTKFETHQIQFLQNPRKLSDSEM